MSGDKNNIVLIGMPGSGKSTLGRVLAKRLGKRFVDTDTLIEQDQNMPIQTIVSRRGLRFMRRLEERVLCDLELEGYVIATGGSAIYSEKALVKLGEHGVRVYLKISLTTLLKRVRNIDSRGLVKMPSYSLPRLYAERLPLYEAKADIQIDNDRPVTAVGLDALVKKIALRSGAVS